MMARFSTLILALAALPAVPIITDWRKRVPPPRLLGAVSTVRPAQRSVEGPLGPGGAADLVCPCVIILETFSVHYMVGGWGSG